MPHGGVLLYGKDGVDANSGDPAGPRRAGGEYAMPDSLKVPGAPIRLGWFQATAISNIIWLSHRLSFARIL